MHEAQHRLNVQAIASTRIMEEVGVDAAAMEEFLYCLGVDSKELEGLEQANMLHTLCSSEKDFQMLRRTMFLPNARSRSVATLIDVRTTRQTARERRTRHVARQAPPLAAALLTVPALRGRGRIARYIMSFLLDKTTRQPKPTTVCVCLAHGCHHRTVGVMNFAQHTRAAHSSP